MNLITIFCFFHDGYPIHTRAISFLSSSFVFLLNYLDEHINDNEEMNADMIDALKKDLETMLPNFEEHLRKKYPM